MAWSDTFNKIANIAEEQEGFVTRKQLLGAGLSTSTVTRLIGSTGVLKRVERGIYKLKGTPWNMFEDLYATWLQVSQSAGDHVTVCVSLYWAAYVRQIGVYAVNEYEFTSPVPLSSPRSDVVIYHRPISKQEWTYEYGMPVATPPRIASDLLGLGLPPAEIGRLIYHTLSSRKAGAHDIAHACVAHAENYGMAGASPTKFLEYLLRESHELWKYQPLWLNEVDAHLDK